MIINAAKYSCEGGHGINEDSFLCSAEKGIFIVADGLGGHSSGEKASLAAVDYFEKNCIGGYTEKRITELMEGANTEVTKKGDGGKTTVAAAFTENGNFIYANAGDSRVYYFREGRIIAQTKDHSVCQASADMGMIRPEDIRGSEDRSRLLKVLGGDERLNLKKHYAPIKIQDGDAFLLCSDGFWEYVYEAEMEADLLKSDSSEEWLKHMLKRHILRAENKGDNYTAICGMIRFDGSETYVSPVSETVGTPKASDEKKKTLIAIAVAGVLLIAAAITLAAFLNGGSDDVISEITETSFVSETTTAISESGTEESDTGTSSETVSDTDTSESETDTESETVSETAEADTETSDEETDPETETDPEAETDSEAETDRETETASDTDISETERETSAETAETTSEVSSEETEAETVSDADGSESETEKETASETSEEQPEKTTEKRTSDGVENDLP